MYPEFIAIYVGLVIVVIMLAYIIILLGKISKGMNKSNHVVQGNYQSGPVNTAGNLAFCKKCATQFDASLRQCPNCGTPR